MIEAKFIEVFDEDVKNIGVNWASLDSYALTAGPFTRNWTRGVKGPMGRQANGIENAFGSTGSGSNSFTETSGQPDSETFTDSLADNFTLSDTTSLSGDFSLISTARGDSAVFNAEQFRVVLSALESMNDTKLVIIRRWWS